MVLGFRRRDLEKRQSQRERRAEEAIKRIRVKRRIEKREAELRQLQREEKIEKEKLKLSRSIERKHRIESLKEKAKAFSQKDFNLRQRLRRK